MKLTIKFELSRIEKVTLDHYQDLNRVANEIDNNSEYDESKEAAIHWMRKILDTAMPYEWEDSIVNMAEKWWEMAIDCGEPLSQVIESNPLPILQAGGRNRG